MDSEVRLGKSSNHADATRTNVKEEDDTEEEEEKQYTLFFDFFLPLFVASEY